MFKMLMKRALQLIALVVAGVLVAAVMGILVEHEGDSLVPSLPWIGWLGFTILLSSFVIRDHRKHWNQTSFWVAFAGFLAAHGLLYEVLFQQVHDWRGIWFVPITTLEYLVFSVIAHWVSLSTVTSQRKG